MFSYLRQPGGFYRRLFLLALPIIVQNLITTSLGFLDTFMVGLLGSEQMSAVTVANVPIFIIRDIDWNVTARFHRPYVKVFEEERELTVMLLIDISGSLDFGTQRQMKKDLVAEIAATLAFSAIQNNDKIGVIFFSDRIEKYIPPKSGRKHILSSPCRRRKRVPKVPILLRRP